jgi:hypothetical protein
MSAKAAYFFSFALFRAIPRAIPRANPRASACAPPGRVFGGGAGGFAILDRPDGHRSPRP